MPGRGLSRGLSSLLPGWGRGRDRAPDPRQLSALRWRSCVGVRTQLWQMLPDLTLVVATGSTYEAASSWAPTLGVFPAPLNVRFTNTDDVLPVP